MHGTLVFEIHHRDSLTIQPISPISGQIHVQERRVGIRRDPLGDLVRMSRTTLFSIHRRSSGRQSPIHVHALAITGQRENRFNLQPQLIADLSRASGLLQFSPLR